MATRQQRLDDFDSNGEPPAGELMELLCEDHNGTYVLPFPCRWVDGGWRSIRSDHQIEANALAGEGSDCAALRRDVSTMNLQRIRP